jgi:uncharacterized protein YjbI with pentapeptide repeats
MAGLQAQASTANVAQAQKAEAFTPNGRIQRQGFKNEAQVKLAIKAIETHLEDLTEESELWDRVKEVFRDFGKIPQTAFESHRANLKKQLEILQGQLISKEYTGRTAYLVGLDMQGADLQGAILWGAKLQKAKLQLAGLIGADLFQANLREAKLQGAKLQLAGLIGANLRWADLRWADFLGAYLEEADLQWADLRWAQLQLASLRGAQLQKADLRWAKLIGAYLQEANLRGAKLIGANLVDAFGVPKNINPTMWPELKGTILEYCINQHERSTNAPIDGPRIDISTLEQQRQKYVKTLLASLQN